MWNEYSETILNNWSHDEEWKLKMSIRRIAERGQHTVSNAARVYAKSANKRRPSAWRRTCFLTWPWAQPSVPACGSAHWANRPGVGYAADPPPGCSTPPPWSCRQAWATPVLWSATSRFSINRWTKKVTWRLKRRWARTDSSGQRRQAVPRSSSTELRWWHDLEMKPDCRMATSSKGIGASWLVGLKATIPSQVGLYICMYRGKSAPVYRRLLAVARRIRREAVVALFIHKTVCHHLHLIHGQGKGHCAAAKHWHRRDGRLPWLIWKRTRSSCRTLWIVDGHYVDGRSHFDMLNFSKLNFSKFLRT